MRKFNEVLTDGSINIYPRVDLVNVFANWQLTDYMKLDFGLDNLFNEAYANAQTG